MDRTTAPRSVAAYALACTAAAAATPAVAQSFPLKPVRILVGNGPGTSPDVQMRLVAEKLPAEWKQQVVVENVAGASSNIAAERVAAASGAKLD